ncbi:MAG: STAS domain-containing protein [Pseudomonadota bacterium]
MRPKIAPGPEEGSFTIEGELTFDTVGSLLDFGTKQFEPHSHIVVDLSGVEEADSAGLALLIEWVTWANHSVREMVYENVPERLLNIAAISEVEGLLGAGERWSGFL